MSADNSLSAGATPSAGWRARLRRAYLQLFGIPDYARYLGHMHTHHPEAPVLTARAFHAQAIDRKYCKSGPRCC